MSDVEDFEEQIRLENAEKEKRATLDHGRTKVDEDGTVMEWDSDKAAWFPKIDADFIAKYQMSYGSYQDPAETATKEGNAQTSSDGQQYSLPAGAPPVTDPNYAHWYYNWYSQAGQKSDVNTTTSQSGSEQLSSEDHLKYYEQYYSKDKTGAEGEETAMYDEEANKEYWKKYYEYYHGQASEGAGEDVSEKSKENEKKDKKGKKRKGEKNHSQGWFDIEQQHNTNVYVSGLPTDITDEEFETTMKKCGLLMFDPRVKKPKLKLYKNPDGTLKGDGLCCYIKSESVDLALQILDGYNLRGNVLTVEKAEFKMKGDFDSSKKKKRLTNKEKKRFKEHQEKLFGWKLDKLAKEREKHEKTVIIKNLFDAAEFERNPTLVPKMRNELKEECMKYGEVKKVVIYDRHQEGIGSVTFEGAEQADQCVQSMNERYFQKRQVFVQTWDGKTKYKVEETDEEREKRLRQWEEYLEKGDDGSAPKPSNTATVTTSSAQSESALSGGSSGASASIPSEPERTETGDAQVNRNDSTNAEPDKIQIDNAPVDHEQTEQDKRESEETETTQVAEASVEHAEAEQDERENEEMEEEAKS